MATAGFRARTQWCARAWLALLSAGAVAGCAEAGPRRHQVAIRGFTYEPASLTIAVGDTVVWINEDVVPHTATAADRGWDTGSVGAKSSGQVVISQQGRHSYVCAFHPNMRAELSVE